MIAREPEIFSPSIVIPGTVRRPKRIRMYAMCIGGGNSVDLVGDALALQRGFDGRAGVGAVDDVQADVHGAGHYASGRRPQPAEQRAEHGGHLLARGGLVLGAGDEEHRLVERAEQAWASGRSGCSGSSPASTAAPSTCSVSPIP